jgi:hypothetical protein
MWNLWHESTTRNQKISSHILRRRRRRRRPKVALGEKVYESSGHIKKGFPQDVALSFFEIFVNFSYIFFFKIFRKIRKNYKYFLKFNYNLKK